MITLGRSLPIPDLIVLRGPVSAYDARKIEPADIHLLVEVCDTSWAKDMKEKLPLYARSGIPECWLVRLRKRCVYRYTEPSAAGYATRHTFEEDDRIPVADTTLAVADFLPRPA
jgi:Uma2 family endonuclease